MPPVLYYDGICGFCNWTVQFILDHDRKGTMQFAALQSRTGEEMRRAFPELEGVDSVILVEYDDQGAPRAWSRSTAALRICSYLGGVWKIARIAYALPRPLRDLLYDTFARYRYRLFGRKEHCMVPPPEARTRFIDAG